MAAQGFVAEEAERLFAWCRDFGGLTAQEAAGCVNESSIREDDLSPGAMLHIAMTWIYIRCFDFRPEFWPAGTEPWPPHALPLWVQAGWERYHAHQLTGGIYEEAPAQTEDEPPF